jgi:hypothetical protein
MSKVSENFKQVIKFLIAKWILKGFTQMIDADIFNTICQRTKRLQSIHTKKTIGYISLAILSSCT